MIMCLMHSKCFEYASDAVYQMGLLGRLVEIIYLNYFTTCLAQCDTPLQSVFL